MPHSIRVIASFIFFISLHGIVLSQTDLSGLLTDENDEALPYANVLLLNPTDSSLLKGSVTGLDGRFSIPGIESGDYLLSASMVGYSDTYFPNIHVNGENSNLDLGTMKIGEVSEELAEIEVVAKKALFEQKIDRTVVNVQSSITSAGGTALEVLEKSPGVIVNRQSGAISMAGKEGVIVMINGKENRMPIDALVKMLDGMNATNIEKIELITTPPARYDAEGDAGIIDIIMLKSEDYGINGNYSLNAGYGEKEKYGGSINFNGRANKLNVYGDYSFSRNVTFQIFSNERTVNYNGIETYTTSFSERDPFTNVHNGRLGFDLDINDKTIFGGLISGYDSKWDMVAFNDINIRENGQLTSQQGIYNTEINHWKHIMGNLNLEHKISDVSTINIDADYLHYHDDNPTQYEIETFDGQGNLLSTEETFSGKITPIHIWVGRIDFATELHKKLKMETGIKGTFSKFTNDVTVSSRDNGVWIPDPDLSQEYKLEEEVLAAYNSITYQISENTGMSLGLRYEYTMSNLSTVEIPDIVDRKYGYLFPSFFISHNINDDNGINLSYSRRISRPTYNQLAPFIIFLDPTTFFSGNAALQPSLTDAVKADYRFKSFLLSLQYSYDQDPIARFQPRVNQEENTQFITARNMIDRHTAGIALTLPITATKWWEMRFNVNGYWQQTRDTYLEEEVNLNQTSLTLNGSQNFTLPKNFSMEVSGFYRSPALFGIVEFQAFGSLNFGLQKKFKNESTLRFNIQDLLNTMKFEGVGDLPEQGLDTRTTYDMEGQIFRLTFSSSFGNKKVKGKRNRKTGSEEERQRVEQ